MRTARWLIVTLSIAASLATGCGAHDHVRMGTEIAPAASPAGPRPPRISDPLRTVALALATPTSQVMAERAARLSTDLQSALAATGAFDRIEAPGAAGSAPLLRVQVATHLYDVTDTTGDDFGISVVGYLFLGVFSDWFHERACGLRYDFDVTLCDAAGRKIQALPRFHGVSGADLSFWERRGGAWPTVATVFWVPPMIFDSNLDGIERRFAPDALSGPAFQVAAAVAALRAKPIDLIDVQTRPIDGLQATVLQPAKGPLGKSNAILVKIAGPRLSHVTLVSIGDAVVFDASREKIASDAKDLSVGLPAVLLTPAVPILVLVRIDQALPVPIAEIALDRTWALRAAKP